MSLKNLTEDWASVEMQQLVICQTITSITIKRDLLKQILRFVKPGNVNIQCIITNFGSCRV